MSDKDLPTNIYRTPCKQKYRVVIRHLGRQVNLGVFDTLEDAQTRIGQFREVYPKERKSPWMPGDKI